MCEPARGRKVSSALVWVCLKRVEAWALYHRRSYTDKKAEGLAVDEKWSGEESFNLASPSIMPRD